MANTTRVNITSPVGRIVEGNLYKPNTTDFDGKPLVTKTGANVGQPRSDFYFALAIPKIPGHSHWANTEWGQKILAVGAAAFPAMYQSPSFAWKVIDGDSAIPNKRGTLPKDKQGYPGNWVIRFSGGIAPKIYKQEDGGYVQVLETDFIKPGYFVEVAFNVDGNGNQNNPGVYINHSMVCFRAYGPEITFGPDVNEAGFGQAPLPAGASAMPLAGAIPLPGAAAAIPTVPAIGVTAATLPSPIAGVAVLPQPQFLQVPVPVAGIPTAPVVPALPAIPSPSSGPQMTAKAGSGTREQFLAQGWTDANLIAHGYMTAG